MKILLIKIEIRLRMLWLDVQLAYCQVRMEYWMWRAWMVEGGMSYREFRKKLLKEYYEQKN